MRDFDRQSRFFGSDGQNRIQNTSVAIVGIGGIGTHVVQQLALLGVRDYVLIDPQELDDTNLNRYVGARLDDPIPGTFKVDIGERIICSIEPNAKVVKLRVELQTAEVLKAIEGVDVVFGCLDKESLRFILNHFCVAFAKPLFDSASGVEASADEPVRYGGHVFVMWEPPGCIVCCGKLDMDDVNRELASEGDLQNRELIYGVDSQLLGQTGPSVVSLNGVVASLAVTEFMVAVTGLRKPFRSLSYLGHMGKVTRADPEPGDCFTCTLWGKAKQADPRQFLHLTT
ncbi:MAG: ThiF family adenylyltransferase [bacterium]|nr:ThiF family adenylyltransferase [bacterium]